MKKVKQKHMHVELWDETTLFCRQLEWAKRRKLAEWTISWVCKSSLPPEKKSIFTDRQEVQGGGHAVFSEKRVLHGRKDSQIGTSLSYFHSNARSGAESWVLRDVRSCGALN